MKRDAALNPEFLEAEVSTIKEDDYCTARSDFHLDENYQIAGYRNNLEAKDDVLGLSLESDKPIYNSQDETRLYFHKDATFDNSVGELVFQDNLTEAKSSLGLESDIALFRNNEEFTANGLGSASATLFGERIGLELEENGFSIGANFNDFETTKPSLLGVDELEMEGIFLPGNSEDVGLTPSSDFLGYYGSEIAYTLFPNEPETAALSADYLLQQDISSKENLALEAVTGMHIEDPVMFSNSCAAETKNSFVEASTPVIMDCSKAYSDLDPLTGLQVENPHTFANYENRTMDLGATFEQEGIIVRDMENSLQPADVIGITTSNMSQIPDGEIHFDGVTQNIFETDPGVAGNAFPDLNFSMVESYQVFQIDKKINSKSFEATLDDGLALENDFYKTDNCCDLVKYTPKGFSNLQPHEFLEKIIGISVEETEKKVEIYLLVNNGVFKNNNFYLDKVTLTN